MGLYKIPYSVINKVLTHTAMSFAGQFLIVPLNLKKGNTKIKLKYFHSKGPINMVQEHRHKF